HARRSPARYDGPCRACARTVGPRLSGAGAACGFRRLGCRPSGRSLLLDRRIAGAPRGRGWQDHRRQGTPRMNPAIGPAAREIGLALQGGGAHGAFTWGVLDRLLEVDEIGFDRISGTSSGAINALALVQGWMEGGRQGARACLRRTWERIGGHPQAAAWIFGGGAQPGQAATQTLHRYFGPREDNPLGFNP